MVVEIGRIHLQAARGDKSAMRPFAKLLWTVVDVYFGCC